MENSQNSIRKCYDLKYNWKFSRDENIQESEIILENYNIATNKNINWQTVRVPHDWAINGPFNRFNDLQITRITQDGEEDDHEHNGRTGGLPHVGKGYYRKEIIIEDDLVNKCVFFDFDGIMSNSQIFLNGQKIGGRAFGYSSFRVDAMKTAVKGKNILVVTAENKGESSRWYPGGGIYRNVRLNIVNNIHFNNWGVFAYCKFNNILKEKAIVNLEIECNNFSDFLEKKCDIIVNVKAPNDEIIENVIDLNNFTLNNQKLNKFTTKFAVQQPVLWDIDNPVNYTVEVILKDHETKEILDVEYIPLGIRTIKFSNENGFELNGRTVDVRGVCMHHDLGPLGAAVNYRALERQVELLQNMGCNAIRTSHNPPAPELLDICDKRGVLVFDEAFDEWREKKVSNGYHTIFDAEAEKDLASLVLRDRNHPCVIAWSIGNEIPDQDIAEGADTARYLCDIVKKLDSTRPTTAGFDHPDEAIANKLADAVDLVGWNYKQHRYREFHNKNKNWICYGSETMSTVSSRGIYHFPVEEQTMWHESFSDDLQLSSYDIVAPPWACLMESEFHYQEQSPFIFGQFVWTGFDYLGEPTPFGEEWPSRSSYFGVLDLVGLEKDRYYMFKSQWCEDENILYILPHWTWHGRVGQKTPIHIYGNCDEVELFLNGRSLGRKTKNGTLANLLHHYRFIWDDVLYETGTVEAKGYKNGKLVSSEIVQTALHANNIKLTADRSELNADGEDMAFITVEITDKNGVLQPHADNLLNVEITGVGELLAFDAGNPCSLEPFFTPQVEAFGGKAVIYLRTLKDQKGEIIITVSNPDLEPKSIIIKSQV